MTSVRHGSDNGLAPGCTWFPIACRTCLPGARRPLASLPPLPFQRNVVGVVAAKLSVAAAVATSGALPENVNYAVKSSLLLSFLESVPEVAARLKEPSAQDRRFEDVVKSAEQAAVLVLVY
jgi:hypothetical protein